MTILEEESTDKEVLMPGYIAHKGDLNTFMRWFYAANPARLDRANATLPVEMRSMPLLTFAIMMPSNVRIDLMSFLLQRGSDVNKRSVSGRSAVFIRLLPYLIAGTKTSLPCF